MGVTVNVLQAGLVHVLMAVLGAVGVAVGVLVLDVVMVVRRMWVRVGDLAMLVFVRVGRVVGVLSGHRCLSLRQMCCADSLFTRCRCAAGSARALIR